MFRGSIVALVTPLKNNAIDIEKLKELVEFHISEGSHAIVAAGTTGESGTLTAEEKYLVIRTVLEQSKERVPVIAGTAANSTQECIALTQKAMEAGAYAALIMTPAYIKPTQEGLYQHYSSIAQAVPIPIILYNVPGRTACDILPETVVRLSKWSNIIGIKDATGDDARLPTLLENCHGAFKVYSGDDINAASWMLKGAHGVISVTANVAPRMVAQLCDFALDKNQEACLALDGKLKSLHRLLFIESNPIPVKWALSQMKLIENELRLPLTPLAAENQAELREALKELQLI